MVKHNAKDQAFNGYLLVPPRIDHPRFHGRPQQPSYPLSKCPYGDVPSNHQMAGHRCPYGYGSLRDGANFNHLTRRYQTAEPPRMPPLTWSTIDVSVPPPPLPHLPSAQHDGF